MSEKNTEKKQNGILAIFTKEYKYEGLFLLFLSLIAIVLGTMVLLNPGMINEAVFLIGDYPKAFAWVLIILGLLSFILAVWPFFKPSISEIRRVTWPSKGTLFQNTATVFAFILIIALFFMLVDFGMRYLLDLFDWIKN